MNGFSPQEKMTEEAETNDELGGSSTHVSYISTNENTESPTMSELTESSHAEFECVSAKNASIVLDFSAVNYVDSNAVKAIFELVEDFKKVKVFIYICAPQGKLTLNYILKIKSINTIIADNFIRMLYHMNYLHKFDAHLYISVDEAIEHYNCSAEDPMKF